MYHPSVIRERLALAQHDLDSSPSRPKSERFTLTPHSLRAAREGVRHLDSIRQKDGKLSRQLTAKERQWITNERLICKCDFAYYCSRYVFIKSTLGGTSERTILFNFNLPQRMFLEGWADDEQRGVAIGDFVLKVRQIGISTFIEVAVGSRALFYPNVNGLIASSDPDKTWEMGGIILYMIARLPYWLLPPDLKTFQSGEVLLEVPSQDSAISIQHGTQMSGVARGRSPTDVHCSEMGEYKNATEIIDASLMRAWHEAAESMMVFEGTGRGVHTWWHKKWDFATQNYPLGKSRFKPRFYAWYLGDGVWPKKNWLKKFPVPEGWQPSETTKAHAAAAAEYVASEPQYKRHLGEGWTMPRHQQWFYEFDRGQHEAENILNKFLQEAPARPSDCWQTDAGHPIFNAVEIEDLMTRIKPPIGVFAIVGTDIPEKFIPPHRIVDTSRPAIPIVSQWNQKYREQFRLIPIKWRGYQETGWECLLYMWEAPQDGFEYGVGNDTAEGIGADRTVIEVLKKGTLRRPAMQVAEFASSWISATMVVPWQMAIASLYSVKTSEGERKQARLIIDVTKSDAPQVEARKRGWTNFHPWERYDRKKRQLTNTIGWYQMQWARDYLVDYTTSHLKQIWIQVNSPWLIEELRDLEKSETRQRIEAMSGAHDDRFFSLGMAHMTLHVWAHIFHNALLALGGEEQQSHLPPTYAATARTRNALPVPPMLNYEEKMEELEGMGGRTARVYEDQLMSGIQGLGEDFLAEW